MNFLPLAAIIDGIQIAQFVKPPVPDNWQNLTMPVGQTSGVQPSPAGEPSPSKGNPSPTNPTGNPYSLFSDPWKWLKWETGTDPKYWEENIPRTVSGFGEIGLTLLLVAILLIAIAAMLTGGNPVPYVIDKVKGGLPIE